MAQQFDSPSGLPVFRTKLMTLKRAQALVKMLQANARFKGVSMTRQPLAHGDRCWFVIFRSVKPEKMITREQAKRDDKARLEGAGYAFTRLGDGKYSCFNPATGKSYELNPIEGSCTCGDYVHKLAGNRIGLVCKHVSALRAALVTGCDNGNA